MTPSRFLVFVSHQVFRGSFEYFGVYVAILLSLCKSCTGFVSLF